jgi:hypothetical protein
MSILIALPVAVYDGLLDKCSPLSREYVILKNGVVRRDLDRGSDAVVEILCEVQRARFLRDFATLVFPEAVPYIEKSLDLVQED